MTAVQGLEGRITSHSPEFGRRQFLRGALAGIAGGALAGGAAALGARSVLTTTSPIQGTPEIAQHQEQSTRAVLERDGQRIYRDGDIIESEFCPIKVDGWRLLISAYDLEKCAFDRPTEEVTIQLLQASIDLQMVAQDSTQGTPSADSSSTAFSDLVSAPQVIAIRNGKIEPSPSVQKIEIDAQEYFVLSTFPSLQDEIVDLYLSTSNQDRSTPPTPVAVAANSDIRLDEARRLNVHAESPMPLKDLEQIDRLPQWFSLFGIKSKIFVPRRREGYEQTGNVSITVQPSGELGIVVPSEAFNTPRYEQEGEITAFHQLALAMVREAFISPNNEFYSKLAKDAIRDINFSIGKMYERSSMYPNNLVNLYMFNEYRYAVGASAADLPREEEFTYDDVFEFMASALTTLHYYPEEFIRERVSDDTGKYYGTDMILESLWSFLRGIDPKGNHVLNFLIPQQENIKAVEDPMTTNRY